MPGKAWQGVSLVSLTFLSDSIIHVIFPLLSPPDGLFLCCFKIEINLFAGRELGEQHV
jgi:hypothetical protein